MGQKQHAGSESSPGMRSPDSSEQVSETKAAATRLGEPLDIVLEDVSLRLCGGGGVFYPAAGALLVADLHLGKGASFRKHAIPVPRGSTSATLDRVTELLVRTNASQLFILGDLFHAPASLSAAAIDAFVGFCGKRPEVAMRLVRGNHDRGIDRLAKELPIEVVDEGYTLCDLRLRHHPPETPAESLTVAGHLHPSFRLRTASEDLGRQRCFWYASRCLVLPAIGQFTGTHPVRPGRNDRVWVDLGDRVIDVASIGGRGKADRGRATRRPPR